MRGEFRLQSQLARRRRLGLYALASMVVALSLLGVMKVLPYSTFLIEDVAVVATEPDPVRGFAIGSVRWDVEQLSRDKSLTPFRRYFFETCREQAGTQAAMCLSEAFAKAFAAGEP